MLFSSKSSFYLLVVALSLCIGPIESFSQIDSLLKDIKLEGDFRFRAEHDWASRKSDGTYREDRTRLRYRLRAGAEFERDWYRTGFRIRTGNPIKQQDPQLTLGDASKEFGTLQIGLEKAFFEGHFKSFGFWVGKNTYPFEKSNEVFWSDNVFPEGIFLQQGVSINSAWLDSLALKGGHFIMNANGGLLDTDAYVQGLQLYSGFFSNRIEFFPSFYVFRNIPNVPDGAGTFNINYSILHFGSRFCLHQKSKLNLELDYYLNIKDYSGSDSIPSNFKDQKQGFTGAISFGELKQVKDWFFKATYAYMHQFSMLDYMAQNDWVRWDYSNFNSPDGRISNFNGVELVGAYKVSKKVNLVAKYYYVEQLVPYGLAIETGSRFRFDIDVKF